MLFRSTTGSLETLEVFSENGSFVWRTRENSPVQSDSPPDRSGSGSPQPAIRNLKQQAAWRAKLEFMQRMQPQFGWVYRDRGGELQLSLWFRTNASTNPM